MKKQWKPGDGVLSSPFFFAITAVRNSKSWLSVITRKEEPWVAVTVIPGIYQVCHMFGFGLCGDCLGVSVMLISLGIVLELLIVYQVIN